jgi:hypothetical protein
VDSNFWRDLSQHVKAIGAVVARQKVETDTRTFDKQTLLALADWASEAATGMQAHLMKLREIFRDAAERQ